MKIIRHTATILIMLFAGSQFVFAGTNPTIKPKVQFRSSTTKTISILPNIRMLPGIAISPLSPIKGQTVTFKAKLKVENSKAERVDIVGAIDGHGVIYKHFDTVGKDQIIPLSFQWTAKEGTHKVSFSIDPAKLWPDANRNDNTIAMEFKVKPKLEINVNSSAKNISMQESIKFVSLSHSTLAPKTGDHVISRLKVKSFYGSFTDIKIQCSRSIIPWSTGFKTDHKYEVLRIPSVKTGETRELIMEWDAIEGSTVFQCVLEKTKPNNERIELYDEKEWKLPVTRDEQCQNGQNQLADIELVRFVYHSQTRDRDNQDYTIRWRNNSPKCVQVMRWKMINMEDGKEVTWGSYIGGGGLYSIKGYDYQEITGQVRKADIKKFRDVGGYWNLRATLKVVLDFDSIIPESNESNNSDTVTFEWHE
jgi:hypothetical protein